MVISEPLFNIILEESTLVYLSKPSILNCCNDFVVKFLLTYLDF